MSKNDSTMFENDKNKILVLTFRKVRRRDIPLTKHTQQSTQFVLQNANNDLHKISLLRKTGMRSNMGTIVKIFENPSCTVIVLSFKTNLS